ncbi:hypothetical protein C2845_PM14G18570 [Panicum miliaceum]|uniref:BTB domain-containing protein n=1 Tax=Panicum miliaceum TaxID=4540 RepID=A0A3L6PKI1_PANMI|nr:hypothetical protein C2845_PM14G18570 [Panicum miliaceum]
MTIVMLRHNLVANSAVGEQHGSAGLEGRPIDFRFHEFRLDYEQTKHLAFKHGIHSDPFSAGSHMWSLSCFPYVAPDKGEYISIFVRLESKPGSVSAIVEVSFMDKDGKPSLAAGRRTGVHLFQHKDWGWVHLVPKTDLVKNYVTEGHIRIVCGIMVVNGCSIPVPPSDVVEHLGTLLDSTDGADVSFIIDSETFHAHRVVLGARSPVFRAELLGSMAETPSLEMASLVTAPQG